MCPLYEPSVEDMRKAELEDQPDYFAVSWWFGFEKLSSQVDIQELMESSGVMSERYIRLLVFGDYAEDDGSIWTKCKNMKQTKSDSIILYDKSSN